MGSRMLSNVKVQEYRAELARSAFNIEEAVATVHEVMRLKKRPDLRLSAAESVLAHAGISGKKDQQTAPVVNLIMPSAPAPLPKKK
jgi:hypothetical protein